MKNLTLTVFLLLVSVVGAFAQGGDEADIRKFIAAYDEAYRNLDASFIEKNAIPEFTIIEGGEVTTRAKVISETIERKANPKTKMISFTTQTESIRITGNTATVTGTWTAVSSSLKVPGAAPHTDSGRYTLIVEKRDGRWMLVTEHDSEMPHDRKEMEKQVLAASNALDSAMRERDVARYSDFLHVDYKYTSDDGQIVSRDADIARFANRKTVFSKFEITDKKVVITSNTTAVETGMYVVEGTANGKPFVDKGRYTATWIWSDLRWQIIAEHSSAIGK